MRRVVGEVVRHRVTAEAGERLAGDEVGRLVHRAARVVDVPQSSRSRVALDVRVRQVPLGQRPGDRQSGGPAPITQVSYWFSLTGPVLSAMHQGLQGTYAPHGRRELTPAATEGTAAARRRPLLPGPADLTVALLSAGCPDGTTGYAAAARVPLQRCVIEAGVFTAPRVASASSGHPTLRGGRGACAPVGARLPRRRQREGERLVDHRNVGGRDGHHPLVAEGAALFGEGTQP